MKRLEQYDVWGIATATIFYDGSFNCRGQFTLDSVKKLADSIIELGRLLAPLIVQPAADVPGLDGFDYRLVAGHRRYTAITTFLKWPEIPCVIVRGLSEHSARILNFTENLERKDLNPLEEALAIRSLYPNGAPIAQIARELSKDGKWVNARTRLLRLPEEVQQLVAAKRVTLLDLEIICRKDTPEDQIKAAEALAASKRGQGRNAEFVGEKLTRSFKRRKNKSEINAMIGRLMQLGVETKVSCSRILAWAAGYVTDDEIEVDIQAVL